MSRRHQLHVQEEGQTVADVGVDVDADAETTVCYFIYFVDYL